MLNTTLVTVQKKGCVTIPWHLRTKIGIDVGDTMEVSVKNGKVLFAPKAAVAKRQSAKKADTGGTRKK